MRSIIVGGALANKWGNGGEAWVRLNWILGLKKLGFEVFFLEQIDAASCCDEHGRRAPFDESVNLRYFKQVVETFGLAETCGLIHENGERTFGLSRRRVLELAGDAAALVNISGHLNWGPLLDRCRLKLYVDIDPGFTQIWHALGEGDLGLRHHDRLFTIGENIGQPGCPIPTGGLRWITTRQPVVLEQWPESSQADFDRFTTVASWRGPFGPLSWRGNSYGLKVHEFRKFIELPERSRRTFELALNIHRDDIRDLRKLDQHGWRIVDPADVANGPLSFREYVQTSGAEFSVAQGVYVDTASGWFSDRTVRYLASAKPALVQDTGFARSFPTGRGLIAFTNMEEAVTGAHSIADNYQEHSRAARALAERYFDSDRVLTQFLEQAGVSR